MKKSSQFPSPDVIVIEGFTGGMKFTWTYPGVKFVVPKKLATWVMVGIAVFVALFAAAFKISGVPLALFVASAAITTGLYVSYESISPNTKVTVLKDGFATDNGGMKATTDYTSVANELVGLWQRELSPQEQELREALEVVLAMISVLDDVDEVSQWKMLYVLTCLGRCAGGYPDVYGEDALFIDGVKTLSSLVKEKEDALLS